MPYPNLKHWTVALENSALHLLAHRPEVLDHDLYRIQAEPCEKHGDMCTVSFTAHSSITIDGS